MIVRVKDEARPLVRALELVRAQTVPVELIVVDSGSTDGSREVAARHCDRLIEIRPDEFSYGRALNVGAAAASAPVHFALSAHCFPERNDWIERSLAHYDERDDVAATNGIQTFADGRPVEGVFFQDAAHLRADPFWGFSNHASSWRASVWQQFPFDEQIAYAEDREWSWRVTAAGYLIAFDPDLWVDLAHQWQGGVRNIYRRQRGATAGIGSFAGLPQFTAADALRAWWRDIPADRHSAAFHRFANYRRWAGIAGRYAGARKPHATGAA